MNLFKYKAIDRNGSLIKNTIESENILDAETTIKEKGLILLKISETKNIFSFITSHKKNLSLKQSLDFISNFSMMISTGLTIKNALDAMKESVNDRIILNLIENTLDNLIRGESLSKAISKSSPTLSSELIAMIDAAENNGNLELVLENIDAYLERKNKFQQKMTNALIYPFFLFMVTIIVLNIIFTQVIPQFAITFSDAGAELPKMTRILFYISSFLESHGIIIASVILILILLALGLRQLKSYKIFMSSIKLKIPYLNSLIINANLNRFTRQIYINLLSGIQMDKSISLSVDSLSNLKMKSEMELIPQNIRKGNSLSASLKDVNSIPKYIISMVEAGEQSGSLITVFNKISIQLDTHLDNNLERLNKLIEPIIIIFIGIVISIIAFAILSPILSLNEFV